ncbi:hypothetical protein [Pseudaestuariivita atlantica]|uniref:Uncharacterized protein n=1 Tax=Pseudaestuariivita atlantica TaxID=1317121 RepID=A0A0L1JL13_9RHOB|nr:hypothetical protein [Pseudaestuariivita atlantica]KNG92113.1 hypothetical protein ATO11_19135 [Pseudaestuariivita atlantica]
MNTIASAPMESGVVRQQLERILKSSQFVETTRLQRFLRYLVDQKLAGNDEALKGYSIGLDVFDKPDDFDPAIDTIVRVQASKLRSRLDLYYATDGSEDPLRILVPKGSYVPVFQVAFDPETADRTQAAAGAGADAGPDTRYSIAVMPFDNLSGSPDQEFLADGFTEEILNALARFKEFRVAARHSTFRYKNKKGDAREIGSELGVRYILEGSVRRWKDQIRVTSQLIDAETGGHMLSETYDDDMNVQNLFDIQETIASRIAAEVAEPHGVIHKLGSAHRKAATTDLDAYESRLLASEYWRSPSADAHRRVGRLLERAVALDPDYSGAWAMLAIVYGDEVRFGFESDSATPPLDRALEAAKRAVAADPKDAAGYHALFMTHFHRNEMSAFQEAADRALSLNPNYPDMLADYGLCIGFSRDHAEGLDYIRRASDLSPDPPGWFKLNTAILLYLQRDYEAARAAIEGSSLGASFWGDIARAMINAKLDRPRIARDRMDSALAQMPAFPAIAREALAIWNIRPEDMDHMVEGWRAAGLTLPD